MVASRENINVEQTTDFGLTWTFAPTRYPGCSYSVHPLFLVFGFFVVRYFVALINCELEWSIDETIPVPGFQTFCNSLVFILVSGGTVQSEVKYEQLKVKAKTVFSDFIRDTKLIYLGLHHINLTNSGGVLHPIDNFLKHMYDRLSPRQAALAFATYKRTNPTLQLRLAQLEKYAEPLVESIPVSELDAVLDGLLDEISSEDGFPTLACEIRKNVQERNFADLRIDYSSASGYPYAQGRKKKDDRVDAEFEAQKILDDDTAFDDYVNGHVWYTTGRAKLQGRDDADAGRLIIYAGYAYLLVAMLAIQPWCAFMNSSFDWCAVGFSWMHDGAGKLARYMEADKGFAPRGHRFVSLDISGWDNKLHHSIMMLLRKFYRVMLIKSGCPQVYVDRFVRLLTGMIEAPVLFPMQHLFKLLQGMKSGWAATANDNTLLHELVMRAIMARLGYMKHLLYGDDNLLLVPDHITDDQLVEEYARFGLKVKYIHSSRYIGDVDFLSKHIIYNNGNYYVFRESVETHSRLLMPEEMDPRRRDRPDPVIAVERLLGHLLDNPFNGEVRRTIYTMLETLRDHYSVEYIEVHDGLIREHPWRNFDVSMIPKRFPTVPDPSFIEELYGVPIVSNLRVVWPARVDFIPFARIGVSDRILFDSAAEFANDVRYKLGQVAKTKSKVIVKRLSPFSQPKNCYGFHAARFEFAIKYFSISFNSLLDLGSHPGACAASASKYCNEIVCVSKKSPKDNREFCPYVTRGAHVHCIRADADHFVPRKHFDLQHDDVDIVGARSEKDDVEVALGMIRRARMNIRHVGQSLFTIKGIDWRVINDLYHLYSDYGYIDFVKPAYSNPWKNEFMVYARKSKDPRIRKNLFVQQMNGFLNATAVGMFRWSELLLNAISEYKGHEWVEPNQNQSDHYEEDWIRPWDYVPPEVGAYLTLADCRPSGLGDQPVGRNVDECSLICHHGDD
eukprot:138458_1